MRSFLDFYEGEDRKWLSREFPSAVKTSDPEIAASIARVEKRKKEIEAWQKEQDRKLKLEEEEDSE